MNTAAEHRRARRRRVSQRVDVIDMMTGESLGQLANVSENGMLLLARPPLREDCLFQVRFLLPSRSETPLPIDVGVHFLWGHEMGAAGQSWVGARFLSMTEESSERLRAWIDAPDATYV